MITITSANYVDPHQSPNCSLLLYIACEPNSFTGETALDNAQAFVERAKLLASTPLAAGLLAVDDDGHLLTQVTLTYMIRAAEKRGAESANAKLDAARLKKPTKRKAKSRK